METVMSLPVLRLADEKIAAGRAAWKRLKGRAQQDRDDWREVGEALLEGRGFGPERKKTNTFRVWCEDNGFGDMCRHDRADAMWLAENWDEVWLCLAHGAPNSGLSHPRRIRMAYREALKALAGPEETTTEKPHELDVEHIRKLDKLASHPATPPHEAESAAAKRDELLERYGIDLDELRGAAEATEAQEQTDREDDASLMILADRLKSKSSEWLAERLFVAALNNPDLLVSLAKEVNR